MLTNKPTLISVIVVALVLLSGCSSQKWYETSREPAGIAADPNLESSAIIEFYAADAFSWRGWFAVHTWIAVKEENAKEYTVYEVVGWRVKRDLPALKEYKTTTPDRYWYGSKPEKILSIKGERAKALLPRVIKAIDAYPYKDEYTLFPGPNSNTFPTWVGLQVPELGLEMPFRAIGSGYAD